MATNVSMASEAAIREAVRNVIQNAHMDKIVGNPTHVTLSTLRKQAAKIVCTIPPVNGEEQPAILPSSSTKTNSAWPPTMSMPMSTASLPCPSCQPD